MIVVTALLLNTPVDRPRSRSRSARLQACRLVAAGFAAVQAQAPPTDRDCWRCIQLLERPA